MINDEFKSIEKEITNRDIVLGMIILFSCGFALAYSHWGIGLPWW